MSLTVAGTRRRSRAAHTRVGAASALALALAAAGCAHRAPAPGAAPSAPPPRPAAAGVPAPPRPRPAPGYVARRDSLPAPGAMPLAGRRIVLDPGHGGFFRGCIGVDGLTEAEVNLGVALELDTLLRAQGAGVRLTRTSDRDFLEPADSTLKHDLAERVRIANAFTPDLFVSIHHNADPGGAHDVNETQVYWKLGDDGPSYDAGTDVFRSLVRNVGIDARQLLPGNFAVVRGAAAPALLTESSYLTNPDVEAKLRTRASRRLEAEALDVGIVRYFARRAPEIVRFETGLAPDTPEPAWPDGRLHASPETRFYAVIRGAFDVVDLRVDGERALTEIADSLVEGHPREPLAGGRHVATLAVRLAGEGAARARALEFDVETQATRLELDAPGHADAVDAHLLPLRVRVLDENGLPWTNPGTCTVRVAGTPRLAAPAETTITIRDGIGWAYLRVREPRRASRLVLSATLPTEDGETELTARWEERLAPGHAGTSGCRIGVARAMPGGEPLRDVAGTTGSTPALEWLDRNGVATLRADRTGHTHAPQLAGFRAWGADTTFPPRYVPIAGGALHGRRIVLDPEGGGDDAAGSGPSGTRAAALNLDVARTLAGLLAAAGADVTLTRTGDVPVSEFARVQVAEGAHADRVLRIGHAAAPPLAGHYFSSAAGRRWGERVSRACAALGLADSLPVAVAATYVLTQSSATALYASLARIDTPAGEAHLLAPGTLRAEAYALWLALAGEFAPESTWAGDSLEVRGADGRPLAGAAVRFGGALLLQAGPDGRVRFARTEPGPLEVDIEDSRLRSRTVLLDSEHGRILAVAR